ncbi:MAG: hypothetical protein ACRDO4_01095 [Nocardioides sp.]
MTEYYGDFEVVAPSEELDEEPATPAPCSFCYERPAVWIARLSDDDTLRSWALASVWYACDGCRGSAAAGRLPRLHGQGVFAELSAEQAAHPLTRLNAATFTHVH